MVRNPAAAAATRPGTALPDRATAQAAGELRPAAARRGRRGWGALAGLLVLALALRLAGLGRPPLWVDEAATLGLVALPWGALFGVFAWLEPTPPAYYALIKLWLGLGIAPDAEAGLRLPSAVFGVAALVPLYLFCRAAFGVPAALTSALLLAVSAQHLHYSQQARVYALLFLVFAGGLLAAQSLRAAAVAGRRGLAPAAALAGLTAALISLHGTGVFAAASLYAYALAALAAERRLAGATLRRFLIAGAAGLVLGAPTLLLSAEIARSGDVSVAWMPRPSPEYLAWILRRLLLAPFLDSWGAPPGPGAALAAAASLGALAFGAFAACRWLPEPRGRAEAAGLLVAFGFALGCIYAVSQVRPILLERSLLFTLAFAVPLLGAGLVAVWRWRSWMAAVLAVALVAPQVPGLVSQYARRSHAGEGWREAATLIAGAAGPRDAVLVLGHFETVSMAFYLARAGRAVMPVRPVLSDGLDPLAAVTVAWMTAAGTAGTVREGMGTTDLCAALPPDVAELWVVSRPDGVYPESRRAVARMLRDSGGATMQAERLFDELPVQHWSAPARCGGS